MGAAVMAAYKAREGGLEPIAMGFQRLDGWGGNATALEPDAVHANPFLEDHLDTAAQKGASRETVRLRVEAMRETLERLTGFDGPRWDVAWRGVVVRVELQG